MLSRRTLSEGSALEFDNGAQVVKSLVTTIVLSPGDT
jgi:hypothetical protein